MPHSLPGGTVCKPVRILTTSGILYHELVVFVRFARNRNAKFIYNSVLYCNMLSGTRSKSYEKGVCFSKFQLFIFGEQREDGAVVMIINKTLLLVES